MKTTASRKKTTRTVRSTNTLVIPRKASAPRPAAPPPRALIHDIVRKTPTPAVARTPVVKSVRAVTRPRTLQEAVDSDKRAFIKTAGVVGLGVVAASVLPKTAEAYVTGSSPTSGVVGLKNALNTRIDPATESGNLASIKTNTDPLVASGGGAYVRQDSNATIAKETGGNLAALAGKDFATEATLAAIKTQTDKFTFSGSNLLTTGGGGGGGATTLENTAGTEINPATDDSLQYLRRIVKLMESQATVDSANRQRITLDSLGTGTAITTTVPVSGTVTATVANATVASLAGQNQQMYQDVARNAYANGIRQNLVFS